jgi:hypothetical protein
MFILYLVFNLAIDSLNFDGLTDSDSASDSLYWRALLLTVAWGIVSSIGHLIVP